MTRTSILDAQRDSRRRKTQDDNQAAALSSSAWIRLLGLDLLRSLHDRYQALSCKPHTMMRVTRQGKFGSW